MVLDKNSTDAFTVALVSPNSPAERAGFKKGEKIALIDGKPIAAWPVEQIMAFQMAEAGTAHRLNMLDGTVRQITAVDFF